MSHPQSTDFRDYNAGFYKIHDSQGCITGFLIVTMSPGMITRSYFPVGKGQDVSLAEDLAEKLYDLNFQEGHIDLELVRSLIRQLDEMSNDI